VKSNEANSQKATISSGKSYARIVTSTSVLGGAQLVVYLTSLLRTKVLAMMLGVSGIGTVGLYQSILTFIQSLTNLGIGTSGAREMAAIGKSSEEPSRQRTATIINRASWLTGIFGLLVTWASASALSRFIFQSGEYAYSIALIGPAVLFTSLAAGRSAILQGLHLITPLARVQIISSILGIPIFLLFCWWLGLDGVVPSILVLSIVTWLLLSFASRHFVPRYTILSWRETWVGSQHLLKLGVALMWSVVVSGALAFATRALIVRELGIDSNGIFQAAWTISGMFIGFVLAAMGMDFLPRLTAAAGNKVQIRRLVNEQTEIGLLMSLPGLLATATLAPLLVPLLYTTKFSESAILVPWLIAGCLAQVISWPLAFIQIARGEIWSYVVAQTLFNIVHFILIYFGLRHFGLVGVAAALPTVYALYTAGISWYVAISAGFKWSGAVVRLIMLSLASGAFVLFTAALLPPHYQSVVGTLVATVVLIACLKGLSFRLGADHPFNKIIDPIARFVRLGSFR
jgi:enterobacterial common antigen flippase